MSTIRDGLFVLVSLLLGFTLALASPRYAEPRLLLVEEAVSIGTTYLRASTLPQTYREHSLRLLREYVDARLDLDNAGLDGARFAEVTSRSERIQEELWADAASLSQTDCSAVAAGVVALIADLDTPSSGLIRLDQRAMQRL